MALSVAYNSSDKAATLTTLPFGYLFWPTGKELLQCFLLNRVLGRPLTFNQIQDVDVYGRNPNQLLLDISYELDTFGSQIWGYFFVHREPNTNHRAPGGYWKVIGDEKKVLRDDSSIIGHKKILKFYSGDASNGDETKFLMEEYTLNPNASDELTDLASQVIENSVVCRVSKVLRHPWRIELEDCDSIFEEEFESDYAEEEGNEEEVISVGDSVPDYLVGLLNQ